jgi:carbon monoxide dehydrogenase subunit G
MEFSGIVQIAAPREEVFAFVTDPNRVGSCGPGVESIEVVDDRHFKARAKVGVGFISAKFAIDLNLAETEAPDRAVIKARGQAPGSAVDATGTMNLVDGDTPGTTQMIWAANVQISGMIASVGARLISSTADKLIKQTFDCIRTRLEA